MQYRQRMASEKGHSMKRGRLAFAFLFCFAITSCATQTKFTYPSSSTIRRINGPPLPISVAVLPANDERQGVNRSGTLFVGYIPLSPFGWMTYNRPESSMVFLTIGKFEMDASEDIAKAVAKHLEKSGSVRKAFFDYGGLSDQADYVLKINLNQMKYEGTMYTYLLSVYGTLLWFFGLPAGTSVVDVDIGLELVDKAGKVAWAGTIRGQHKVVQGLYYNSGRDMEGVAIIVQDQLEKLLGDQPFLVKK